MGLRCRGNIRIAAEVTKQSLVNRGPSGELPRNILNVETATMETLNLAYWTLLKKSLYDTNSNEVRTSGNYVRGSQAYPKRSDAWPFRNAGLCAPVQAGTEQNNCS